MPGEGPPSEETKKKFDDAIFQLILLGLATVTGPIDNEDRERARRILKVTDSRDAIREIFPDGVDDITWDASRSRRAWAEALLRGENVAKK